MELIFKETCEVQREYTIDIDAQDFIEWLDGEDPSESLLEEYIVSEVLPYEGPTDEIEGTLTSEIIHANDFLDSLEDENE